jgi:ubiquitin-protein ligase E3 C
VLAYPGDVEADMCMSFVAPGAGPGREDIELIPGGAEIPVTSENRRQFVDAYSEYVLRRRVLRQMNAFKLGFNVCLSARTLQLFNEEELEVRCFCTCWITMM